MAHCEVLSENFSRYGLTLAPQECSGIFGSGKMSGIGEIATSLGASLPRHWEEEIFTELFARLSLGVPVIDGVVDIVDWLRRTSIDYCVASNGSLEKMAIMFDGAGLIDRFDGAMYSAHVIGVWKPDPALFLYAAAQRGVDPTECIVIEDSKTGVIAARRAGMKCLGYTTGPEGHELEGEGAIVFHDMADVPGLLV